MVTMVIKAPYISYSQGVRARPIYASVDLGHKLILIIEVIQIERFVDLPAMPPGRVQDLWKGGGGGGAAATASATGAKVFGGSRLKTLFGISIGGGKFQKFHQASEKL